jgi:hypothetical protein
VKRFSYWRDFFGQRHDLDYSGESCVRQPDAA